MPDTVRFVHRDPSIASGAGWIGGLRWRLDLLNRSEVETVVRTVRYSEQAGLLPIARLATWLGNGWLYPLLSILFAMDPIRISGRFQVAAALSLFVAFLGYPLLKRCLRRTRPCDQDPSLAHSPVPLDRYSCPSGHAMTAAAWGVPLIFERPSMGLLVVGICAVVGWSRIALGHHYVSDVLIGTFLGAATASLLSSLLY